MTIMSTHVLFYYLNNLYNIYIIIIIMKYYFIYLLGDVSVSVRCDSMYTWYCVLLVRDRGGHVIDS